MSKGDTKQNWSKHNPILLIREVGYELDTNSYKIGDGVTHWNELPYATIGIKDNDKVILQSNQVYLSNNEKVATENDYVTECHVARRENELLILYKKHTAEDIAAAYQSGKKIRLSVYDSTNTASRKVWLGYFELSETDKSTYFTFVRNIDFNMCYKIQVTSDSWNGEYKTLVKEDFVVTCDLTGFPGNVEVSNVSATFDEILAAYDEGKEIKLRAFWDQYAADVYFSLSSHNADDFRFVVVSDLLEGIYVISINLADECEILKQLELRG